MDLLNKCIDIQTMVPNIVGMTMKGKIKYTPYRYGQTDFNLATELYDSFSWFNLLIFNVFRCIEFGAVFIRHFVQMK